MDNKPEPTKLFGIEIIGETVKGTLDGIGTFLSKICMPVAEEVGLYFRDKARAWRLQNLVEIIKKADGKLTIDKDLTGLSVHPKLINELIEHATWNDDKLIQDMWAGLLINSMEEGTPKGKNTLFLDALKELTPTQARILEFSCRNCKVKQYHNGLLSAAMQEVTFEQLTELTGEKDVTQLDAEMDALRSNDLISGGFRASSAPLKANIAPTAFALQLYAKCQGNIDSISGFYKDQITEGDDDPDFQPITLLSV